MKAPSEIHVGSVQGRKIRARNRLFIWGRVGGGGTVTALFGQGRLKKRKARVRKGQWQQQHRGNRANIRRTTAERAPGQPELNTRTTADTSRAPAQQQQKDNRWNGEKTGTDTSNGQVCKFTRTAPVLTRYSSGAAPLQPRESSPAQTRDRPKQCFPPRTRLV